MKTWLGRKAPLAPLSARFRIQEIAGNRFDAVDRARAARKTRHRPSPRTPGVAPNYFPTMPLTPAINADLVMLTRPRYCLSYKHHAAIAHDDLPRHIVRVRRSQKCRRGRRDPAGVAGRPMQNGRPRRRLMNSPISLITPLSIISRSSPSQSGVTTTTPGAMPFTVILCGCKFARRRLRERDHRRLAGTIGGEFRIALDARQWRRC